MKVLFIAQHSISMVSGGPLVQARETASHLQDLGVEVEFFDPWKKYQLSDFDLAHIFGATLSTYDIAVRLKHFGLKYAVSSIFFTLHGPFFIRTARAIERMGSRMFSGIRSDYSQATAICQAADVVLPNTISEAHIVTSGFEVPEDRVRVIPNGVNERFLNADPTLFQSTYNLKDFILNVGHIGSARKNVLRLIQSLESIDRPTVIIGKIHESPYATSCLQSARLIKHITIIDGLDNDSDMLASAYAACDVFALPSLFETPGIAALEAALAGAKIVITKHGGTVDYFGSDAEYVDPFSVGSIQKGIRSALAKPRATGPGSLRNHILENFTWPVVARKTAEVYREILAR